MDEIAREMLRKFGPVDEWIIPVDDIEAIIVNGVCEHLLPSINDCQECMVRALVARQMTILAERLGCTPEDAKAVGEKLSRKRRA